MEKDGRSSAMSEGEGLDEEDDDGDDDEEGGAETEEQSGNESETNEQEEDVSRDDLMLQNFSWVISCDLLHVPGWVEMRLKNLNYCVSSLFYCRCFLRPFKISNSE